MCSEETFSEVIMEGNFVENNLKVGPEDFYLLNIQSLNMAIEEMKPKSSALQFSFAQLMSLLGSKFNWDPIYGPSTKKGAVVNDSGFDENGWDREDGDYAPVVVEIDSEEEDTMDMDVNFGDRVSAGGHMDMRTGKMVFD
jgi:hypothetical protein